MAGQNTSEWSTGLFDCLEDKVACCYGFFCCPCMACQISDKLGESRFLPACDILSLGALSSVGMPLSVAPVALSFRMVVRQKYGIKSFRFCSIVCPGLSVLVAATLDTPHSPPQLSESTTGFPAQSVQQAMVTQPITNWSTGLFDCCEDISTCCYGFWCCPCLACTVSGKFGENRCLPLCDILSPAITSAIGIPLCVPPAVLAMRVAIRHRYGIKGSLCKDMATSCFCEWCSWCQMHRELKHRNNAPTVIVNVQPAQVRTVP